MNDRRIGRGVSLEEKPSIADMIEAVEQQIAVVERYVGTTPVGVQAHARELLILGGILDLLTDVMLGLLVPAPESTQALLSEFLDAKRRG